MPRPTSQNGFADLIGALRKSHACADHPPLACSSSPDDAQFWWDVVQNCSPQMRWDHLRWLGRHDLFFLLVHLLNRKHFLADERKTKWTFARCAEVQNDPDGHLDLWPRESFKCTSKRAMATLSDGRVKCVAELKPGDLVQSLDHSGHTTWAPVVAVRDAGQQLLRTYRTTTGRTFDITAEHRMMGPDGTWPTGEQLTIGSWVALPSKIERVTRETLTIDECAYVGFMMSDGNTTQSNAKFAGVDEPVIARFTEAAQGCGFTVNRRPYGDILVSGALPFQRRMGIQGCKSTEKRIPQELFHQPEPQLWAFLAAFIDSDGYVPKLIGSASRVLGINLANYGLINDLRHLYDLLGLRGSISPRRENDFDGWWSISLYQPRDHRRCAELLPLSHPRKRARLQKLAERVVDYDHSDPIPRGWEKLLTRTPNSRHFRNQGIDYSYPPPAWVTRRKVERFAAADGSTALTAYLDADIFWDRIEEVSEPYEDETIDLQIGGTQTYHLNGVISHNSEIITFGKTIQDILNDPEITVGIFSHSRPMAKDFLALVKREFEFNALLKEIYDEILWQDPRLDARAAGVSWSENEGITVRRRGNPKEATVEASGLVDGQPTGKRYRLLIYDDVVSRDNISPVTIQNTTEQFYNSLLLTASDPPRFRYIGTPQEFGDTTAQLIQRNVGNLRLHGPFDEDRKPSYLSDEKFAFFKSALSPKVFALQILLDPSQAKDPAEVGFNHDWIDYWDADDLALYAMNKYVLVDPAGNNPESNSAYAQWVVALGADKRIRVLDIVRDKFDLEERWEAVFNAVVRYEPLKVGYEKIGFQSDIEHMRYRMRQINNIFTIVELGGGHSKDGRIGWLIPPFRDKRILFPRNGLKKKLKNGDEVDMVRWFIDNEYLIWPFNPKTRDLLDALSRLFDPALNVVWPRRYNAGSAEYPPSGFANSGTSGGSWMSG